MNTNPQADKEEEPFIEPDKHDENSQAVGYGRVLFSIRDMLVLTTITAVIVVLAPSMKLLVVGISVNAWIIALWSMLVVVILITRFRGTVRRNVLSRAGNLWISGTVRDLEWQQRLHSVVWLQLVFALLLMLSMSIWVGLAFGEQGNLAFVTPMYITVSDALPLVFMAIWFLSSAFFSLFWKVYPGQVEFYDRGVCMNGYRFYAWKQIDQLVPSVAYRSSIALTLRPFALWGRSQGQPYTFVIRMPKDGVQNLLERYGAKHPSGTASSGSESRVS